MKDTSTLFIGASVTSDTPEANKGISVYIKYVAFFAAGPIVKSKL